MTIKEIYDILENLMTKPGRKANEDFEVVVKTSEPCMAPPGVTPVKSVDIGIDHHKNEIIITPKESLIPKRCDRDNFRGPIIKYEWYRPKGIAYCPNCQSDTGDAKFFPNYCPCCGQQLKKDEEIPWKRREA